MLKQLSIYAENKKGVMQNITGILKDEDINILGSVTNDSAEYGIVRMVVSEPDKAMEALIAAGYLCHVIEVIGVEVEDKTGNLNDLLLTLKDSNVSVDYLYLSFNRDSGKPIMVFHTEDIMEVRSCLNPEAIPFIKTGFYRVVEAFIRLINIKIFYIINMKYQFYKCIWPCYHISIIVLNL